MKELEELINILAIEPGKEPELPKFESTTELKEENLWQLQEAIEAMIWVMTYDFKPTIKGLEYTDPNSQQLIVLQKPDWTEAPLPDFIWKRLIKRFHDPDEHKSFRKLECGLI